MKIGHFVENQKIFIDEDIKDQDYIDVISKKRQQSIKTCLDPLMFIMAGHIHSTKDMTKSTEAFIKFIQRSVLIIRHCLNRWSTKG